MQHTMLIFFYRFVVAIIDGDNVVIMVVVVHNKVLMSDGALTALQARM